jgi:hypothetical protein
MWDVRVDGDDLRDFARLLDKEAEPKKLRRQLATELRKSLTPAAAEAKSSIMAMGSSGPSHPAPALRPTIARKIRPAIRLSGRVTGARVLAPKTHAVRGFPNAPKLSNRDKWRRRVFGADDWVTQRGKPDWFDDPMNERQDAYRDAAQRVLQDWAARLARKGG